MCKNEQKESNQQFQKHNKCLRKRIKITEILWFDYIMQTIYSPQNLVTDETEMEYSAD